MSCCILAAFAFHIETCYFSAVATIEIGISIERQSHFILHDDVRCVHFTFHQIEYSNRTQRQTSTGLED